MSPEEYRTALFSLVADELVRRPTDNDAVLAEALHVIASVIQSAIHWPREVSDQ